MKGEWNATLSMQAEERKDVRMIATVSGDDQCYARHDLVLSASTDMADHTTPHRS